MDQKPSMLKPTLIGGAVFGALSGIPIVGALNCLCCALVVGSGFLAAFLYSKECAGMGVGFRAGNGAVVGLVAGLFHAVFFAVVSGLFGLLQSRADQVAQIEELLGRMEEQGADPQALEFAENIAEMFLGAMGIVFLFLFMLLLGAVFATIGGLIGGAVFKIEPSPPAAQPPGGDAGMLRG